MLRLDSMTAVKWQTGLRASAAVDGDAVKLTGSVACEGERYKRRRPARSRLQAQRGSSRLHKVASPITCCANRCLLSMPAQVKRRRMPRMPLVLCYDASEAPASSVLR